MKRYILFAFSLLMAFPLGVFAQDDDTEDEDFDFLKPKRTATVKKNYETRTIKGTVFDGATKQPLAGAIVRAAEVDGYSVLTDDNGTFELKLPLFASAIYVTSPDHNPVRIRSHGSGQSRKATGRNALSVNFHCRVWPSGQCTW